jgi:SAM-dependent methyltransferase
MGIPSQFARIILREHRYRPIAGVILSIARQTVYLTAEQASELVEYELGQRPAHQPSTLEFDRQTRGSHGRQLITDRAFYSLFSDAMYSCVDVTAYEGADIIADLCSPLPSDLENRFDFIVNGSCLDNIFDPAMALRNMTRLLKPGGRIIHMERASRMHKVYVAFALSWFHDYYAINEFADCQVYLAQWDDLLAGRWDLYRYSPILEQHGHLTYFGEDCFYFPYRDGHAIVIAEKAERSSWEKSPVQFEYRTGLRFEQINGVSHLAPQALPEDENDPYFRSALRFFHSNRAPIVSEIDKVRLADHLVPDDPRIPYCGSIQPLAEA